MVHHNNPQTHANSSYGADTIKSLSLAERNLINKIISNQLLPTLLFYDEYKPIITSGSYPSSELNSILLISILSNFKELKEYARESDEHNMEVYQLIKLLNISNKDWLIKKLDLEKSLEIDRFLEVIYTSPAFDRLYHNIQKYINIDFIMNHFFTNHVLDNFFIHLLCIKRLNSTFPLYDNKVFKSIYIALTDNIFPMQKLITSYKENGMLEAIQNKDYDRVYEIFMDYKLHKEKLLLHSYFFTNNLIFPSNFTVILNNYIRVPLNEIPPFILLILLSSSGTRIEKTKEGIYYIDHDDYPFVSKTENPPDFIAKYQSQIISRLDINKPLIENLLTIFYYDTKLMAHPLTDKQKEFITDILNKFEKRCNKKKSTAGIEEHMCKFVMPAYKKYPDIFRYYIDYLRLYRVVAPQSTSIFPSSYSFYKEGAYMDEIKNLSEKDKFTLKFLLYNNNSL